MPAASVLDGLNPAQRTAAEAVRGPVCILAGAGTGKTRTITHRIAHQVATGTARSDQILAVTFTDRAAGELRARLAGLAVQGTVRAATFHAAAWAQLRHFWPSVHPGAPLPAVLASKVPLLVRAAARWKVEARDLAAEIEWAKARCVDPDGYVAAAAGRTAPLEPERMATIYAGYEATKTEREAIDYEDMLLAMTALLTARPDIAAIVRDRYRFLTVDEFQDVNPAQWALLRAWLGDSDELCVVGDDDQMIYRFTGASADYLTGFRAHFPAAEVVTLTQSYRSTPPILDLANRVLWTKPKALRKRLVATRTSGEEPGFHGLADDDEETKAVIGRIATLRAEGVPAGGIAIIYRVNAQSSAWEEALADAGVPYVVRGEGGFFDRPEVVQALRALRAAAGRGPVTAAPGPEGALPAAPARADRTVEAVLREAMSWHPRREPAGEAARERWRNLGALLDAAARVVDADPAVDLAGVVAALSARAATGADTADEEGAVTLLTYHKAKGLEFDAVFLVACEEGTLPISHAKTDAAIEEERRLLYVGVTRARTHLWLSWAAERPGWGGRVTRRRPSRLLYRLAPDAPAGDRAAGAALGATARGSTTQRRAELFADCDPALVERLRTWRRERALADEVPAFVVFGDRTLADLATQRPAGLADLRRVHGLGPAKVERYGSDLLAILAAA